MKLFKHKNYDHYREAQIWNNKRKIHRTWATEKEMEYLSNYIQIHIPDVKHGLCHGARNCKEVRWFKKHLPNIEMIGTDISPTVTQFDDGVQWDFHLMKPEWKDRFDFIYSNSFDHSNDPKGAIEVWLQCLKPNGFCVIQWSPCGCRDAPLNEVDCFSARLQEYKEIFSHVGVLKETLRNRKIREHDNVLLYFLIVGRKEQAPSIPML